MDPRIRQHVDYMNMSDVEIIEEDMGLLAGLTQEEIDILCRPLPVNQQTSVGVHQPSPPPVFRPSSPLPPELEDFSVQRERILAEIKDEILETHGLDFDQDEEEEPRLEEMFPFGFCKCSQSKCLVCRGNHLRRKKEWERRMQSQNPGGLEGGSSGTETWHCWDGEEESVEEDYAWSLAWSNDYEPTVPSFTEPSSGAPTNSMVH